MVSRTRKFRGSRTHGKGTKKGRGAGLRGGRGKAGLHKHKYISVVKHMPDHFGRHGFKRPQKVIRAKNAINISEVEERIEQFIEQGFGKRSKGRVEINLKDAGYDKLLGKGIVRSKMIITVPDASEKAKAKVANAGGSLVLSKDEQ